MSELPAVSLKTVDARTNGASTIAVSAIAAGRAGRDPMAAVMDLGRSFERAATVALVLALAVHAGAAARAVFGPEELSSWARLVTARVHDRLAVEVDLIETKPPEPPPPPPEPEKEETPPAPPPPVAAPPPKDAPKDVPPPAPAAAKAGAVLTQEPDPNEPVDLTNSFVTGNAETYAGGTTQQAGTSDKAVYNPAARATGVPAGTGTAPPVPTVDRSRAPICGAGETNWNCPFPPEADTAQIDDAKVTIRVTVGLDGAISKVDVLNDPGYGFGREARRCALRQRCTPGLDRNGNPAAGLTKTINITFDRR